MRKRMGMLSASAAALLLASAPAAAENMNQTYGPSWRCRAISFDGGPLDRLRAACEVCERQGQDFFRTGPDTGRCVPRAGSGPRPSAEAPADWSRPGELPLSSQPSRRYVSAAPGTPPANVPQKRRWSAIAAGIDESRSPALAAVGMGRNHPTRARAEERALAECSEAGVSDCTIQGSWNQGCAYATTGSNGSVVGWATSKTKEGVYAKCAEMGLSCREPIGGCAD